MNTATKPADLAPPVKQGKGRARRWLKWTGWTAAAALVAAGALYGPELVGLVRLSGEIDAIAQEDARLGGQWPRATDACIYCHGFEGNARAQTYPKLAGQPEAYLKKQLQAFASGERTDPTMTPLALSMPEAELAAFAAHFSKMKVLPNDTFKPDEASATRGAALAKAGNCASCHGDQFQGKGEFPRLAGQGHDYLRDQLTRFKNGLRRDPSGVMPAMAAPLSDRDIDDLAQFLASR